MTQAFNLGQLANKVNTSGQLDASTGLVNSAPVANGGTGRATLTAGTVLIGNDTSQVTMLAGTTTNDALIWSGTAWASSPISVAGGGGGYALTARTSPASYTKPASLKAIKVTVIGAGGVGGTGNRTPPSGLVPGTPTTGGGGGAGGMAVYYALAPVLPASPITVTAGAGTNSFGVLASATAGSQGATGGTAGPGGTTPGGTGSGGSINIVGQGGGPGQGQGGSSQYGGGSGAGVAATGYGAGGGGGTGPGVGGAAGSAGIVIIEEFF